MAQTTIAQCPLCSLDQTEITQELLRSAFLVNCKNCKRFYISDTLLDIAKQNEEFKQVRHLLSGLSRERTDTHAPEITFFTTNNYKDSVLDPQVPKDSDIAAKAQKLLYSLKLRSTHFGHRIQLLCNSDRATAYARNDEEFFALIKLLEQSELVEVTNDTSNGVIIQVQANGWNLTKKQPTKMPQKGFVAARFVDEMDEPIRSIKNAIEATGYSAICIKDKFFPEQISTKALGEIRESRFVVADLTHRSNSVFFEVGFAHALGIDVIYVYNAEHTSTEGKQLEFYTRHYQCHPYRNTAELEGIVSDAIKARVGGP